MARHLHQTESNKPKNVKRDPTVNRAAGHNYFLEEKMEAGMVLTGSEVKSVRSGRANLKDAYALVKDGELWLLNAHIGAYEHGGYANHAPLRTRKLLVHKDQLRKLLGKSQQRGYTLVPTRMYFKNGKIKCEIALARGRSRSKRGDCEIEKRKIKQIAIIAKIAKIENQKTGKLWIQD